MKPQLVSVIIPVYNVKKYLNRCLDSIINQTYDNIEIILINDGSTDTSREVCHLYSKKDKRIKVIDKINGGLSDARNCGLRRAVGEYVVFVDSDDFVDLNYIKNLYITASKNNADIVACGYSEIYENKKMPEKYIKKLVNSKMLIMDNLDAMRDFFSTSSIANVVTWNKIYKISIFKNNNIKFPVGKIHEDNFTTYKLYYYANKIIYIDQPLYFYLRRADSIMGKGFSKKSFNMVEAADEALYFVGNNNIPLQNEVRLYNLNINIIFLNLMSDSDYYDRDVWVDLKNRLLVLAKYLYKARVIEMRQIIYIVAVLLGSRGYWVLRRIMTVTKRNGVI